MILMNRKLVEDKIHACWIGKNIGGSLGAPYEGKTEMQNVTGFVHEKGEPLPNDDLDLQLVWLAALEEVGAHRLSARDLAEYWISYVVPHWNEYGVAKSNLKAGILPPLSGELNNEEWRHSNGAWIRSEIWACLAPGYSEIARHFAFMDACVDHGMGEGTIAEQFTVTMESLAFRYSDLRWILEESLKAIPAESRVARSIRLVMEYYDGGKSMVEARNALVEDSKDLGWFQAPANLGYVVLGLLYGEGDFKKSMLAAVNCGDDTDCTAATVGAFLGILKGTDGLPADWAEYIGDRIVTNSVDLTCRRIRTLNTCTALTERVMAQIPAVLNSFDLRVEYTEGENRFETVTNLTKNNAYRFGEPLGSINWARYSYEAFDNAVLYARVEYDRSPILMEGEELEATVVFHNRRHDAQQLNVRLLLPEGVSANKIYSRFYVDHQRPDGDRWSVKLKAERFSSPLLRVIAQIEMVGRPEVGYVPILLIAK